MKDRIKPEKRGKKPFSDRKWYLRFRIVFPLVILVVLILFCCLVFSINPLVLSPETPDEEEIILLENVIHKFAETLVDQNGEVVQTATLILSPDETDALVKGCLRSYFQFQDIPSEIRIQGDWEQGALRLNGSFFWQSWLPCMNGSLEIIPFWSGQKLSLQLRRCKIGHLCLPESVLSGMIEKYLSRFQKTEEYKELERIFVTVNTLSDGSLRIIFHPVEISRFTRFLLMGLP